MRRNERLASFGHMPFYFAYGANLDVAAMAGRCPHARPVGTARLMNFRFFIMRAGVASVRREQAAVVHGLLWSLKLSDVGPLDTFEDVEAGLYTKTVQPVLKAVGSVQAFLYIGHTTEPGLPLPGYLDAVVDAAEAVGLPVAYCRSLRGWGAKGTRGAAFDNFAAESPAGPVAGVRPRHKTPFEVR